MQPTPAKMGMKLLSVLFTDRELVNGNLTGVTTSKLPERIATIKKLNEKRVGYMKGNVA